MFAYKRLKNIINISELTPKIIFTIVVYAVFIGIFSLIIPIAAQSLINIVAFTALKQPILVLTLIVMIFLLGASILRIFQRLIIEIIQQKIFAKIAIELADKLPQITTEAFYNFPGQSAAAANRFYDIPIIKKSTATLLLYGLELIIQAFVSLILLASYHPYLLIFDLFLIVAILLALLPPWKNAVATAITESIDKHNMGGWIGELARNHTFFKLENNHAYALEKADRKVIDYLKSRKHHFRYILYHVFATYAIYILSTGALLGLGGYLVMKQQLTLGQLVAAEIIVTVLLYNLLNLGNYLEITYDMISSCDEVGSVLDLPQDKNMSRQYLEQKLLLPSTAKGMRIDICNINFTTTSQQKIFHDLNFTVETGESLAIVAPSAAGKSVLINMLLGFIAPDSGLIKFNGIPAKDYSFSMLRAQTALVRGPQIFSGTILENLTMNLNKMPNAEIQWYLEKLNLAEPIAHFPLGLQTEISSNQHLFSSTQVIKLMLIRAFITTPKLLLIDGALDIMPDQEALDILNFYCQMNADCTLILTTNRIAPLFNKTIRL